MPVLPFSFIEFTRFNMKELNFQQNLILSKDVYKLDIEVINEDVELFFDIKLNKNSPEYRSFIFHVAFTLALSSFSSLLVRFEDEKKVKAMQKGLHQFVKGEISSSDWIYLVHDEVNIFLKSNHWEDIFGSNQICYLIFEQIEEKGHHEFNLENVIDDVLDGESLTNVFQNRQGIYEWLYLDVFPNAFEGKCSIYSYSLCFVKTNEYLKQVSKH